MGRIAPVWRSDGLRLSALQPQVLQAGFVLLLEFATGCYFHGIVT